MASYERPLLGRVLSTLQRFGELIHVVTGPLTTTPVATTKFPLCPPTIRAAAGDIGPTLASALTQAVGASAAHGRIVTI